MGQLRLVHSARRSRPPAHELDATIQALLEQGRIMAPLPPLVRARALARARAVLRTRR